MACGGSLRFPMANPLVLQQPIVTLYVICANYNYNSKMCKTISCVFNSIFMLRVTIEEYGV